MQVVRKYSNKFKCYHFKFIHLFNNNVFDNRFHYFNQGNITIKSSAELTTQTQLNKEVNLKRLK